MTPLQFTAAGKSLFPRAPWRARLAAVLEANHHTITRWANGGLEIPERVAWAVYGLQACKEHEKRRWKEIVAMLEARA